MPNPPYFPGGQENPTPPTPAFLLSLYNHLPVLVLHVSADGHVLHCNSEVTRATGYSETALIGKNLWATLFPGKLFAQIPKFISSRGEVPPTPLRDVPLMIRTKDGHERIIAWTRFLFPVTRPSIELNKHSVVMLGVDLTDRLLDADRQMLGPLGSESPKSPEPFGPNIGNAGTIDGEFVTPLAISPPSPLPDPNEKPAGPTPIQQVHEFLTEVDSRIAALEYAFTAGQIGEVSSIAQRLRNGAYACGLLEFSRRAADLHTAATHGYILQLSNLVKDITAMCPKESQRP